jgi:ferritin-like metal-binding protein YciE
MAKLDTLEVLMQDQLKDIYDAEKQLTKALPKMAKKASNEALRSGFNEHLRQTEQHMERLEQVFDQMGMPVRGKTCKGMKNLIAEGDEMMREAEDDDVRDALLIAAAQKIEHYEIAAYGTLRTWAMLLGKNDIAGLLEQTLDEEKETDQRLTEVAESMVNKAAAKDEGDEEETPRTTSRSVRAAGAAAMDRGRKRR